MKNFLKATLAVITGITAVFCILAVYSRLSSKKYITVSE